MASAATGTDIKSRLTVEAALRLPSLRRGAPRVVAGSGGLGRPIRWVHSSEVSNISELLRGDELLLMTGIGLGRSAAQQRRFIRDLAARGVAGLVIELGQAFRKLPGDLVREAERYGLPLIALEREVPFVEVTEELHSAIVNRQLDVFHRVAELHTRLTALMIDGATVPDLLAALAVSIANPVLLEQDGHGILYQATYRSGADEALAAWAIRQGSSAGDRDAVSMPVMARRGRVWGRLLALELDSPLDDFGRAAVEGTVPLVALGLLRGGQEALLRVRERGNFLADLVAGRVSPGDATMRANRLGLRSPWRRVLPVAAAASPRAAAPAVEEAQWAGVWLEVREELRGAGLRGVIGTRPIEEDTLMALALPDGRTRSDAIEAVVAATRAAVGRRIGHADAVAIAAGRVVEAWESLPQALREAAETATHARGAPGRPWHDASVPDFGRLLWNLRTDPHLRRFVEQRLEPVLQHDRTRAAKLLPTLDNLCNHRWHKAEAARALGVNRQSLYPRIGRIERLLGADLDDPETRMSLEFALRARHFLDAG